MQGLPRERKLAAGSNSSVARRHAASPPKCMDALWAEAFYGWGPWTKLASMPAATIHIPVLLEEVLEGLQAAPGGVFVDGTLGGGGHTRALAERVRPAGRVVAASYVAIPEVLAELGIEAVDGILLDLGLSSDQLADASRGFSFDAAGELDLRFDATQGEPAWRLLKRLREQDLADVIYKYGEERLSRRIARKIVERRQQEPIRTAAELAALVRSCVPRGKGHQIDPATRTFQALRIAVNDELGSVEKALASLPDCLKPGGRLAVISFHSLEDRIIKQAFREDPRLTVVTRKPVLATDTETAANPRARSAKLRIAERAAAAP
jgi:16S rRNA (cytosine1402-N4)-methyltransferase